MADISTTAGHAAYLAAKADYVAVVNKTTATAQTKKTAFLDAYKVCLGQMGAEAAHVLSMMESSDC